MEKQRLTILGSTGSVGVSTLDVVARHRDRFELVALAARSRADILFEQCRQFRPRIAVLLDAGAAQDLQHRLREEGVACEVRSGIRALEEVASLPEVYTVMAAIVLMTVASLARAEPAPLPDKPFAEHRIVLQLSDNDPKKQGLVISVAYNLLKLSTEVEEDVVTGAGYREVTAIQPPRSFHLGARVSF